MTDPLTLADEVERMDAMGDLASERRLIAAALRFAEAEVALLKDYIASMLEPGDEEQQNEWAIKRGVLVRRRFDLFDAYRAAREAVR